MSAIKRTTPYTPAPTRMTIDDVQQLGRFFKDLIDSSSLKWWIIAAGLGAVIEALHVLWLAARYILKF